jgi:hypothetical protein
MAPPGAQVVQRAVEEKPVTGKAPATAAEEPNLDDLARQVFPLIKRMLAIERERLP